MLSEKKCMEFEHSWYLNMHHVIFYGVPSFYFVEDYVLLYLLVGNSENKYYVLWAVWIIHFHLSLAMLRNSYVKTANQT